jgi:hypothetical protein
MADNSPEDPSIAVAVKLSREPLINLAGDPDGENFPEEEYNIKVNSGVVLNANPTLTLQTIRS